MQALAWGRTLAVPTAVCQNADVMVRALDWEQVEMELAVYLDWRPDYAGWQFWFPALRCGHYLHSVQGRPSLPELRQGRAMRLPAAWRRHWVFHD